MTADECARLVNLIVSTWPTGVRGHVWTDTLTDLDHHLARAAYLELRDHDDRPPSVARFIATYRAKRAATHDDDQPPSRCRLCDGDGWVTATPLQAHNPRTCSGIPGVAGCACHAVVPCRCSEGDRTRDLAHRIHEHNDRTLRATGRDT